MLERRPLLLRQLVTAATQYAVGGILARALTVVSIPLYLRFLNTEEFGLQAIALLNENILAIISGYAITNAVGKYYTEANGPKAKGIVVGTAVVALTVAGGVLAACWQAAAEPLARLTMDGSETSISLVRLAGVSFVGT